MFWLWCYRLFPYMFCNSEFWTNLLWFYLWESHVVWRWGGHPTTLSTSFCKESRKYHWPEMNFHINTSALGFSDNVPNITSSWICRINRPEVLNSQQTFSALLWALGNPGRFFAISEPESFLFLILSHSWKVSLSRVQVYAGS